MTRCISCLLFVLTLAVLGNGCNETSFSPRYNETAQAAFNLIVDATTQTTFHLHGVNGIITVRGAK